MLHLRPVMLSHGGTLASMDRLGLGIVSLRRQGIALLPSVTRTRMPRCSSLHHRHRLRQTSSPIWPPSWMHPRFRGRSLLNALRTSSCSVIPTPCTTSLLFNGASMLGIGEGQGQQMKRIQRKIRRHLTVSSLVQHPVDHQPAPYPAVTPRLALVTTPEVTAAPLRPLGQQILTGPTRVLSAASPSWRSHRSHHL